MMAEIGRRRRRPSCRITDSNFTYELTGIKIEPQEPTNRQQTDGRCENNNNNNVQAKRKRGIVEDDLRTIKKICTVKDVLDSKVHSGIKRVLYVKDESKIQVKTVEEMKGHENIDFDVKLNSDEVVNTKEAEVHHQVDGTQNDTSGNVIQNKNYVEAIEIDSQNINSIEKGDTESELLKNLNQEDIVKPLTKQNVNQKYINENVKIVENVISKKEENKNSSPKKTVVVKLVSEEDILQNGGKQLDESMVSMSSENDDTAKNLQSEVITDIQKLKGSEKSSDNTDAAKNQANDNSIADVDDENAENSEEAANEAAENSKHESDVLDSKNDCDVVNRDHVLEIITGENTVQRQSSQMETYENLDQIQGKDNQTQEFGVMDNNNQKTTVPDYKQAENRRSSLDGESTLNLETGCTLPAAPEENRKRRPRTSFTSMQSEVLNGIYSVQQVVHWCDRTQLSKLLNLSDFSIKTWFKNARRVSKNDANWIKNHVELLGIFQQQFAVNEKFDLRCKSCHVDVKDHEQLLQHWNRKCSNGNNVNIHNLKPITQNKSHNNLKVVSNGLAVPPMNIFPSPSFFGPFPILPGMNFTTLPMPFTLPNAGQAPIIGGNSGMALPCLPNPVKLEYMPSTSNGVEMNNNSKVKPLVNTSMPCFPEPVAVTDVQNTETENVTNETGSVTETPEHVTFDVVTKSTTTLESLSETDEYKNDSEIPKNVTQDSTNVTGTPKESESVVTSLSSWHIPVSNDSNEKPTDLMGFLGNEQRTILQQFTDTKITKTKTEESEISINAHKTKQPIMKAYSVHDDLAMLASLAADMNNEDTKEETSSDDILDLSMSDSVNSSTNTQGGHRDNGSSPTDVKKKRDRIAFNALQTSVLLAFFQHIQWVAGDDIDYVAELLNLKHSNVKVWFKNARRLSKTDTPLPLNHQKQKGLMKLFQKFHIGQDLGIKCKVCSAALTLYADLLAHWESDCGRPAPQPGRQKSRIQAPAYSNKTSNLLAGVQQLSSSNPMVGGSVSKPDLKAPESNSVQGLVLNQMLASMTNLPLGLQNLGVQQGSLPNPILGGIQQDLLNILHPILPRAPHGSGMTQFDIQSMMSVLNVLKDSGNAINSAGAHTKQTGNPQQSSNMIDMTTKVIEVKPVGIDVSPDNKMAGISNFKSQTNGRQKFNVEENVNSITPIIIQPKNYGDSDDIDDTVVPLDLTNHSKDLEIGNRESSGNSFSNGHNLTILNSYSLVQNTDAKLTEGIEATFNKQKLPKGWKFPEIKIKTEADNAEEIQPAFKKQKRHRTTFPETKTAILSVQFFEECYPQYEQFMYIACLLDISYDAIKLWYKNMRQFTTTHPHSVERRRGLAQEALREHVVIGENLVVGCKKCGVELKDYGEVEKHWEGKCK